MDYVLDTHIHLSADPGDRKYPRAEKPPFETSDYVNTAETHLKAMDEAGVTHATIVQPFGLYGSDNSYHADSALAHPDRLRAICGLSPSPEAVEQVRRWVKERGMSGLRINTRGEKAGLNDPAVDSLAEEATALGVPVNIMMSRRHIENAHALAKRHPKLTLALDHMGGAQPNADDSFKRLESLAEAANIILKLTTNQITAEDAGQNVARIVEVFGADRIMWGTNYPITNHGGYAATVQMARDFLSFLNSEQQAAILGGTAFRVYPGFAKA